MEDDDDFQIDEELDDDLKDFSSDEDKDYDAEREEDKGEPEDRAHDELLERMDLFESMADVAPPILENDNAPTTITQGQAQRGNTSGKLKIVQKKRKGRGPTKSLIVTCPMHLEYDANGQPCGTWRFKYGTHVGLCLRMISILETWSKVSEGVKDLMWSDTMNLFNIENDPFKKKLFLQAVGIRFRDFKAKLVSGWITKRRQRVGRNNKKMKMEAIKENGRAGENGEEEENEGEKEQESEELPFQIYHHITATEWEAFVAKKTTKEAVEKSEIGSSNAKKKMYQHHMGPKTFGESRKEWITSGFYPGSKTSTTEASTTTTEPPTICLDINRSNDFWCAMHGRDVNGRRTISDPGTQRIADAIVTFIRKEATGEFIPERNKDVLYAVLGPDRPRHMVGLGGIGLGVRKVFGKELSTRSVSSVNGPLNLEAMRSSIKEELREEIKESFNVILRQMGMPELPKDVLPPVDTSTHTTIETHTLLKPTTPDVRYMLEEEVPCQLWMDFKESGMAAVANGYAQPYSDTCEYGEFEVVIDNYLDIYADYPLPKPVPEHNFRVLADVCGSLMGWPQSWVRFSDEDLGKLKRDDKREPHAKGNKAKEKEVEQKVEEKKVDQKVKEKEVTKKVTREKNVKAQPKMPSVVLFLRAEVVECLPYGCNWLHTCVSYVPNDEPIPVLLEKSQFNYMEDINTWMYKDDIKEFLSNEKLNVSMIQVFMRQKVKDWVVMSK
ncbi:uncharacterized protein [Spinacia oleracea]|uniref:Uncharacterized protein isoform X2 n=1 Tax=Spinacia oleracea TaxID=3562 RepID=A0ABM3QK71_SPIOL|nr:uncharacterized protein LOC110780084 isoform X2 [Spinacia oleracea]